MRERERAALNRIGDTTRRARRRRLRLRQRAFAVATLIGTLGVTVITPLRPRLVWNASASAPIGLYRVTAPHDIAAGDMVIARVPAAWRQLAAARRYVPATVPLVKRAAAVPGDTVCAIGPAIVIEGRWRAKRRRSDGRGRIMPWWEGCTTLRDGALFLLNDNAASFDGRYFGPTRRSDVIGKAHLLWAKPIAGSNHG